MAGENTAISGASGAGAASGANSGGQTFDDAVKAESAAQNANATEIPEDKLVKVGAGIAAAVILPLIFNNIKYAKEAMEGFDE